MRGAGIALRLRRPGTPPTEIERQVALANWLAQRDFPVNRPAAALGVLHNGLDGAVASFWEWIDNDAAWRIDLPELGILLRRFHDLTEDCPMVTSFPQWDAVAEIGQRVLNLKEEGASWPARSQLSLMEAWTEQAMNELNDVEWQLPSGLIHGDAHTGNVIINRSGKGLLIDLDAVAQGHREWDLVPTAVSQLRFRGDLGPISRFVGAYGFDLLSWSGWPSMRRLRELYMTSWLMTVATSRERREEVELRMNCLRSSGDDLRWQAV